MYVLRTVGPASLFSAVLEGEPIRRTMQEGDFLSRSQCVINSLPSLFAYRSHYSVHMELITDMYGRYVLLPTRRRGVVTNSRASIPDNSAKWNKGGVPDRHPGG